MDAWEPYPDVGLAVIDSEHRAVGLLLQQVTRSMVQDDRDLTLVLTRQLAAKAEAHFAHEEALMRDIGYVDGARHAESHRAFLAEAVERLDDLVAHGLSADFLRWAGQLDQWFRRHVMTEDLFLALAVMRAAGREPPARKK